MFFRGSVGRPVGTVGLWKADPRMEGSAELQLFGIIKKRLKT